jgi:hypothetical protein
MPHVRFNSITIRTRPGGTTGQRTGPSMALAWPCLSRPRALCNITIRTRPDKKYREPKIEPNIPRIEPKIPKPKFALPLFSS